MDYKDIRIENGAMEGRKTELEAENVELERLKQEFLAQQIQLLSATEELENANRELSRINELKSDFIRVVSHELRTPVSALAEGFSLFAQTIVDKLDEEQSLIFKILKDNIARLQELIDDILDLSKLEARRVELNRMPHDPSVIIETATFNLSNAAKKRGIEVIKDIDDNLPKVFIDQIKITQVITNLYTNALKWTREGGKITISAKGRDAKVIVVGVSDTGIGIPANMHEKIFDKFVQVGRRVGDGYQGSGLGLAISKHIVNLHGCDIWVKSEEGNGSTFYFTLPVHNEYMDFENSAREALLKAKESDKKLYIISFKIKNWDTMVKDMTDKEVFALTDKFESNIQSSLRNIEDEVKMLSSGKIFVFVSLPPDIEFAPLFTRILGDIQAKNLSSNIHKVVEFSAKWEEYDGKLPLAKEI